jgi:uncharacterized membrane protein
MSASARPPRSKRSRLALVFLRGLGTLLPVVLTAFVFVTVFQFASSYVTRPINAAIYWGLEGNALGWSGLHRLGIDPYDESFLDVDALPLDLNALGAREGYGRSTNFTNQLALLRAEHEGLVRDLERLCIDPKKLRASVEAKVHPIIGVVLSLVVIFLAGWTLSGFFGRSLLGTLERTLLAIPGVRSVYPYSKQLVEFFLKDQEIAFDAVVAIPYPRRGIWSLGFVTNAAPHSVRVASGRNLVCVFIPSSPMPMTGYTIMVPAEDLIAIPISVDEALRITVSGGVLIPPGEQVEAELRPDVPASADQNRNESAA